MSKRNQKKMEILQFIYDSINEHGFPPTVREMCIAVNLSSTSTIHSHLKDLKKMGYITKDPSKPRTIELTKLGKKILGIAPNDIPVVGTVAAGAPILAEENIEDHFPLPADLKTEAGNLFMLQVQGESMINVGILNGDRIIIKKQNTAENGQIIVAMTDDNEVTVKRFYKESGHFRLQPENDEMEPIILNNVQILGKVIGLYRNTVN